MSTSFPIRFRRGTPAEAASSNPVLAAGEPGWTTDGTYKVGDGSTPWVDLPAYATTAEVDSATDAVAAKVADNVFFGQDVNTPRPALDRPVQWVGYEGFMPVNAADVDDVASNGYFDLISTVRASVITESWNGPDDPASMDTDLTWTIGGGAWRRLDNRGRTNTSGAHYAYAPDVLLEPNHDVEVDLYIVGGSAGGPLLAGVPGERTYYAFENSPSTSEVRLRRWDNGSFTTPASKTLTVASGARLRIVKLGGDITCYVNGVEELAYTDPSPLPGTAAGIGGFQSSANSFSFDNFKTSVAA